MGCVLALGERDLLPCVRGLEGRDWGFFVGGQEGNCEMKTSLKERRMWLESTTYKLHCSFPVLEALTLLHLTPLMNARHLLTTTIHYRIWRSSLILSFASCYIMWCKSLNTIPPPRFKTLQNPSLWTGVQKFLVLTSTSQSIL